MPPSRPTSTSDVASQRPHRPPALFVGNLLWLDFVNTRYVVRGQPVDVLQSYEALGDWLVEAGHVHAGAARYVMERWNGTAEGERVLREAQSLRDALRDLAEALALGEAGPSGAIAQAVGAINRVLRADVCYPTVTQEPAASGIGGGRFTRELRPTDAEPLRVLATVALSASDILCGGADPSLVRRCGNPKCVLCFYDTTKNRHRRFCSSAGCGNRVKAAARYRRAKESGRAGSDE
jgi:predicted RNA-binding Zn ribbon-like protein